MLFQHGIPISDVLLEDLVLSLDEELDDELDYRDLAKGMELWKLEKREAKRRQMSTLSFSSSPCESLPCNSLLLYLYYPLYRSK